MTDDKPVGQGEQAVAAPRTDAMFKEYEVDMDAVSLRASVQLLERELAAAKAERYAWKDLSVVAIMADVPSVREYVKCLEDRYLTAENKLRREIEVSATLAGQASKAEAAIAAANAKLAEFEQDALLYQWLRTHFRFANDSMREIWFDKDVDLVGAYGAHEPAELDAAIIAARKGASDET